MSTDWEDREEEIAEEECTDYFKDPKNHPPRAPLVKAVSAALSTIRDFNNMLPIFAAAIVGGIGNPFGAFLGGYVIAFSEILLTYAYKKFFMYILPESMEPDSLIQLLSTDYKFAVSFSILVIVLLYRPSGIFKGKIL